VETLRVIALALALTGCKPVEPQKLSLDEVAVRLGKPGVFLYDANPQEMYTVGHLPGAKWVEFDHVTAADLPDDHDASLIFYCANEWCTASSTSAKLAVELGYKRVYLMPRGIIGWKKAGKPFEVTP